MTTPRLCIPFLMAAVIAAVGSVLTPGTANAQWDCGTDCVGCGPFPDSYHEGFKEDPLGDHDMDCPSFPNEDCNACPVSVADVSISQEAIGRALVTSRVSEVAALITAYGDRLLLSDTRNLVAIKGNTCGSEVLGVWVAVTPRKMGALRAAELGSLEEVLAEQAAMRSPTR